MVNKRFQKFLFLLLWFFLSAIATVFCVPALSDTPSDISSIAKTGKSSTAISFDSSINSLLSSGYYLAIIAGSIGIVLGIVMIVAGKARFSISCITLGCIAIGISSYLNTFLAGGINLLSLTVFGFLVAMSSGVLYFLGYIFVRSGKLTNYSKYCFDVSAFIAFFGIFILELLIFSQYVSISSKYPMEECKDEKQFLEAQKFFFCVFFGKTPQGEQPLWNLVSFIIFGIILPFSVVFSIVFGLFFGVGLDKLFGKYGKGVTGVIAFATAMFGMRQLIGPLLIDLLAYGAWGIFGIIIALIVPFMIRATGRRFLRDIEAIRGSVISMFRLHELSLLEKIDDFIAECHMVIGRKDAKPEEIDRWIERAETFKGMLEKAKSKVEDEKMKAEFEEYSKKLKDLIAMLKGWKESVEESIAGRKSPEPS